MKTTPAISLGFALITLAMPWNPVRAQAVWNGGEGDYTEPSNWSTGVTPDAATDISILSGTAQLSGSDTLYERAAVSTIDGGTLDLDNYRFLNGRGGPATFNVISGALTMSGTYFIVGQNNAGTFNQSGGNVTLDLRRGFFLTDGAADANTATYNLTGGVLDVGLNGLEANNDPHNMWLGRSSAGNDLFFVDGGTFNLRNSGTPGTTDKRVYIVRNSTFRVDSGIVDIDDLTYFVVGRGNNPGTRANLVLNGGDTAVSVSTAFIVGGGQSARLLLNDGNLSVQPSHTGAGDLWIGDGSTTTYATLDQSGGTLDVAGTLTLGRNAAVFAPEIFLRGGNLTAGNLVRGNSPNARFYFHDGTLTLSGDQTSLVNEPWFITTGTATAVYDGGGDQTVITTAPATGTPSSFQYYRFQADLLGSGQESGTVQLAEFEFLSGGIPLDLAAVTVTNPGGDNLIVNDNPVHPPEWLLDGNLSSKWLDLNNAPLVFDFGSEVTIDGYRFTTANDLPDRDPVRWTLEGSADGVTWEVIDRNLNPQLTPGSRHTRSLDFALPASVEEADLIWTGSESALWNLSAQNWSDGIPRAWENSVVPFTAVFDGQSAGSISLTETVEAGLLRFEAAGYTLAGPEALTLGGDGIISTVADAIIDTSIQGVAGLRKEGSATLELSGDNSYAGNTVIDEGFITYSGNGSSSGSGTLLMATQENARAGLTVDTTGSLSFPGAARVPAAQNASGVIRILRGELSTNGPGTTYLEIGGGAGATKTQAYGALLLEGGSYDSGGGGSASGIRVGNDGLGIIEQSGGHLQAARWFAIGGEGNTEGEGVVNLLAGTTDVADGFRFLIADRVNSIGTLNLGTRAGGSALVTSLNPTGLTVGGNNDAESATLNLNSGTLVLGGPIHRNGSGVTSIVNLDGATLRAGVDDIDLIASSPTAVRLYRGGLTVDTAGKLARVPAALVSPAGNGVYPAGGEFAVADGGGGYLGTPIVRVSTDGTGGGLTATARIQNGSIAAVQLTSPGFNFQAGDTLTFSFHGGGATQPAADLVHTLTAPDLAANAEGSLTVEGGGHLVLSGNADYTGPTSVRSGTFESNGLLGDTTITVDAGATLSGSMDTLGPVVVNGTFSPGSGVGFARGFESIHFGPGSRYVLEINNWTGIAGVGHDTGEFDSVEIGATSSEPLEIVVSGLAVQNFSEQNRSFVLVDSFALSGLSADNWTVSTENLPTTGTFDLAEDDGRLVLNYTAGAGTAYTQWAAGYPGLTDTDPLADPEGDGLENLLEFVLLTDPTLATTEALFTAEADANGDFIFRFVRASDSVDLTTQVFEVSGDLETWDFLPIPVETEGAFTIEADTPQAGRETVTVRVPSATLTDPRLFGRLRVSLD